MDDIAVSPDERCHLYTNVSNANSWTQSALNKRPSISTACGGNGRLRTARAVLVMVCRGIHLFTAQHDFPARARCACACKISRRASIARRTVALLLGPGVLVATQIIMCPRLISEVGGWHGPRLRSLLPRAECPNLRRAFARSKSLAPRQQYRPDGSPFRWDDTGLVPSRLRPQRRAAGTAGGAVM